MSQVTPGYTGKILRVDLTSEQITEEPLDEGSLRLFIGGVGLGAKILYDEVLPGIEWDDPDNLLLFTTGPMNGSKVAGSGAFCVVTKGPLTNGAASSQANGYFGAYLKYSGFDSIIIEGKASRWLYLYIHDGKAELLDAADLIGQDTYETESIIKSKLGQQTSVFGIGPAGENLVKFAAIVGDKGHVAGHNGIGAVMGSKKLKAIAVNRGKPIVMAKNKEELSRLSKKMAEDFKGTMNYKWGTSFLYSTAERLGHLPVKNLTEYSFAETGKFTGEYYREQFELVKWNPCWACPAHHCHTYKITEGPYAGYTAEEPEFEALVSYGCLIGQTDVGAAFVLGDLTDRLGLEVNESGWLFAFLIECFEKGIISEKETDGISIKWGDVETIKIVLHKIANREGFGNLLAEGLMRTAEEFGGEALNIGVYLKKGNAPRSHDHRATWLELFDVATSNTGTLETHGVFLPDPLSQDDIPVANAKNKGPRIFVDCLVMCQNPTMTVMSSKIDHLVAMVNAVTGWDMTTEEADRVGVRTVNLLRAFNIRHGINPEVEAPSIRYKSEPLGGPAKGKSISPYWEQMLNTYYKEMGWDRESGKPLPDTLNDLALDYVIPDIWGKCLS